MCLSHWHIFSRTVAKRNSQISPRDFAKATRLSPSSILYRLSKFSSHACSALRATTVNYRWHWPLWPFSLKRTRRAIWQ